MNTKLIKILVVLILAIPLANARLIQNETGTYDICDEDCIMKETNITNLKNIYENQMNNLDTTIYNARQIQQETNWTNAKVTIAIQNLAWGQEVLAQGQKVILNFLRWVVVRG